MPASFYQPLYFILVTILTISIVNKYSSFKTRMRPRYLSYQGESFLLAIFLIFFIGLRPINGRYFIDMASYNNEYYIAYFGARFWFDWDTENLLFDNLKIWMASQRIDIEYFFFIIALIYFFFMYWASKKLFPRDTLLAFLVYLGAFSTFSYGTNGIKAGAAASFYLVALAYYFENKKILVALFLFLSYGFHHSMLAPIVALICAHYYKKPKSYLYGWIFCLIMAALHITFFMRLFSGYTDEHGAGYLQTVTSNVARNVSGFRIDFITYSAIPLFYGYYCITRKKFASKAYVFLWCTYTLTNCVFLLCTYGSYINRIAYLSWLMIPYILLYPCVNIPWSKSQELTTKYVVYCHLCFTLFMFFIYY